jgi:transcriptional regulator with XRE-family HTH domain
MAIDGSSRNRAARLREALHRREIKKLYGLALDLDVDQSTISRWTKDGGMSLDHAAALCVQLDISLDWLIFGQGGMDLRARDGEGAALADLLERLEPELQASLRTIAQALADR